MSDPVVIVDYNPAWPEMYREEERRVLGAIGPCVVAIEHVGSTAVPGLCAKPIIDIMVGIRSLSDAPACLEPLQGLGYEYHPRAEAMLPERRYFGRTGYHLHMVEATSDFWRRHIRFRDRLRAEPETALAYGELKQRLAARFGTDRGGYTEAKTEFIEGVVRRSCHAAVD